MKTRAKADLKELDSEVGKLIAQPGKRRYCAPQYLFRPESWDGSVNLPTSSSRGPVIEIDAETERILRDKAARARQGGSDGHA